MARRRTRRIARKLALSKPEDVYTMDRSKGMHEETFERLERELIAALDYEEWAFMHTLAKFSKNQKS